MWWVLCAHADWWWKNHILQMADIFLTPALKFDTNFSSFEQDCCTKKTHGEICGHQSKTMVPDWVTRHVNRQKIPNFVDLCLRNVFLFTIGSPLTNLTCLKKQRTNTDAYCGRILDSHLACVWHARNLQGWGYCTLCLKQIIHLQLQTKTVWAFQHGSTLLTC